MKQHQNKACYLEGNTLIFIENDQRTTRGYLTDREAAEAYDALPGEHHAAPWPVATRKEAAAKGLTYYYTGKLCKHNHYQRRLVSSGVCTVCNNDNVKRYNAGVKAVRPLSAPACKAKELQDFINMLNAGHSPDCKVCAHAD